MKTKTTYIFKDITLTDFAMAKIAMKNAGIKLAEIATEFESRYLGDGLITLSFESYTRGLDKYFFI